MQHTPKPWTMIPCPSCPPETNCTSWMVSRSGMTSDRMTKADAQLGAAAPDLLEAAQWVERYVSDMKRRGLMEVPDLAVDALVDAIAAATEGD